MDFISVIMPCCNAANYIESAIQSVLVQNVSTEIIIVDDHSSDNTQNIVVKYMKIADISYYMNPGHGVASARNYGIDKAKGNYVAFLDADDIWKEDKLIKQLGILKQEDTALCYTGREYIKNSGERTGRIINVKKKINYHQLSLHNDIACSSVVMKKEIAVEIPMEHDEYHEDYMMWLKCVKKYGSAVGVNEPLLYYRDSIGGKSRNRLKSFKMTYGVHRCLGKNPLISLFLTISHVCISLIKYL